MMRIYIDRCNDTQYCIYGITTEFILWVDTNTPSRHLLPPEIINPAEVVYIMFDNPVDELAFKLRWI